MQKKSRQTRAEDWIEHGIFPSTAMRVVEAEDRFIEMMGRGFMVQEATTASYMLMAKDQQVTISPILYEPTE